MQKEGHTESPRILLLFILLMFGVASPTFFLQTYWPRPLWNSVEEVPKIIDKVMDEVV